MVFAFEFQIFLTTTTTVLFFALFVLVVVFVLYCFFLMIYYLVGAYKGLGRGFIVANTKKELFHLNSSFKILITFPCTSINCYIQFIYFCIEFNIFTKKAAASPRVVVPLGLNSLFPTPVTTFKLYNR